jgi:hypothetical protein
MDGLRQALMDELAASPVSEGFDFQRSAMSVGALTLPFTLSFAAVLWFSYLRSIESQHV